MTIYLNLPTNDSVQLYGSTLVLFDIERVVDCDKCSVSRMVGEPLDQVNQMKLYLVSDIDS